MRQAERLERDGMQSREADVPRLPRTHSCEASCQARNPNLLTQKLAGQGCREQPGVSAAVSIGCHWLIAGRQSQRQPSVGRPREWGQVGFRSAKNAIADEARSEGRLCRHTAARAQTGRSADPSWLMRGGPPAALQAHKRVCFQSCSTVPKPPFINHSIRMGPCKAVR
jgi:hypothetical protein